MAKDVAIAGALTTYPEQHHIPMIKGCHLSTKSEITVSLLEKVYFGIYICNHNQYIRRCLVKKKTPVGFL